MRTEDADEAGGRRRERWLVSGRVQGVGFRWFVADAARRHGVRGAVCNLPDGRVEIRVVGGADAVAALEREVAGGPAGARVTGVERHGLDDAGTAPDGFEIRR